MWRALASVLIGAVVGLVGTVAHRIVIGSAELPVGIVLALLAVCTGAVFVRAWAGWVALFAYAGAVMVVVWLLAFGSAGGDVLVPGQAVGNVWVIGSSVVAALVAFAPRSWFVDRSASSVPIRPPYPHG